VKILLKKLRVVNFLFELFISFSEYVFLKISKIIELLSKPKILRRLIFNLQPRNKYLFLSTKYGQYIFSTNSRIISKKSYHNKIPYSATNVEKILEILKGENINIEYFIDIGANVGTSSISASFIDKKLKFVCIEGSGESFELLDKNIKINDLEGRFELHKKLVGNKNNSRIFVEFKEERGCSRIFENNNELEKYKKEFGFQVDTIKEVKTEKIENLLEKKLDKKLFLWMDIEGLDLEILNSSITKKLYPIFFEFNPSFYKLKNTEYKKYLEEVESQLLNSGYSYYFIEARNFKKEKIRKRFLVDIVNLIGENKSATNILII